MAQKILKIGVTSFLLTVVSVSRFICNGKRGVNGLIVDNGVDSKELDESMSGSCC